MNNHYTAEANKPTTEVMREVTENARQLFASGERMMDNLEQLQDRAESAANWQAQLSRNPLVILGASFLGGLLLARVFSGRR